MTFPAIESVNTGIIVTAITEFFRGGVAAEAGIFTGGKAHVELLACSVHINSVSIPNHGVPPGIQKYHVVGRKWKI